MLDYIKEKLAAFRTQQLERKLTPFGPLESPWLNFNGQRILNFSSNDYLSLKDNAAIKKMTADAFLKYGLSSGSSAQVCGYFESTCELEKSFAQVLGRDKAILFNSGYLANVGIISALANRHTAIFADKYCHASLIDGILLSKAKLYRFPNNDYADLEKKLAYATEAQKIIVTESVFSTQGALAPIAKIVEIAKKYNAFLIVDDAHGFGVLGNQGLGIVEALKLSQTDLPLLLVPMGKAFASMGALAAGSEETIEYLLQFARTHRYSTALPPALAVASKAVLDLILSHHAPLAQLKANIALLIEEAHKRSLPLLNEDLTAIKSFRVLKPEEALQIQQNLMSKGFAIASMRSPTVPRYLNCVRLSLQAAHTKEQILSLLDALTEEFQNV